MKNILEKYGWIKQENKCPYTGADKYMFTFIHGINSFTYYYGVYFKNILYLKWESHTGNEDNKGQLQFKVTGTTLEIILDSLSLIR